MKTHKDLDVWRAAMELAKNVYEITKNYPKEETYGLVSQMHRCAVSIPSNISEGAARKGNKEFLQFLYVALVSASELDTQLEISTMTKMSEENQLHEIQHKTEKVKRMLSGLIRLIKNKD